MLRGFATINYRAADLPMGAKGYQPIILRSVIDA